MDLKSGDKLGGRYQLISKLGSGGMGEVWKARDTELDRDVALKVSKAEFTARFKQEARAMAAFSHPNICQIYDVGPNYIVMELIDGVQLSGPLPVDKAVAYAGQILDALDAAHRKGFTHRDLKPANVMVTAKGVVKLLDFGLAKRNVRELGPDDETVAALSKEGNIAGTLQYMSPEQLNGKEADARSDIFAFGCVLYEMLSGQKAFSGSTAASVIAAIMEREPEPLQTTPPLDRVIRTCLAKDPDERFQTARDLKRDLLWAVETTPLSGPPTPSRGRLPWIAAAVLFALIAAALAFVHFRETPPETPVTRFQIFAPPGSTLPLGTPAPSPDGKMLAYTVRGQDGIVRIHVRSLNATESRALPGTENAVHPFWSPDGQSLAFVADGNLKRIDLAGGSPRVLAPTGSPWHGSWNQSGIILFTSVTPQQIAATGGAVTPAVRLDEKKGETGSGFPLFLPDGKHLLVRVAHGDTSDIDLASLGSMERKLVLPNIFSAPILAPAPNGKSYLLYLGDTALMAQEFDEKSGTVRGSPSVLVDSIGRAANPPIRPSVGVSATGILAYQAGNSLEQDGQLTWFDRSGKQLSQLSDAASGDEPSLSPDGRFVAVRRASATGNSIWLVDLTRGSSTRFTFGKTTGELFPIWSPDGKRVAYMRIGLGVYVKDANGTGTEHLLTQGLRRPMDWSPDGQLILVRDAATNRLFLLPVSGGSPVPIGPEAGATIEARISPDGKYFAFTGSESGRSEVYVEPMPPGVGKWQISINGGGSPRWRRDGKELFFLSPDLKMMAVDISAGQGISAGIPHALFQTAVNSATGTYYDVSADGQRFLVYSPPLGADAPITVVLNWWAELNWKPPAK
jgi:serine/threonine protein kinase/Tol biopolymer transport system component